MVSINTIVHHNLKATILDMEFCTTKYMNDLSFTSGTIGLGFKVADEVNIFKSHYCFINVIAFSAMIHCTIRICRMSTNGKVDLIKKALAYASAFFWLG